ncbi:MAG: ABC transporter permease subunit [Actinoplanes sp.]
MSLYKAESRRLVKRRFTKLFSLSAVLILLLVAAAMFLSNEKVGPEQIASAKAEAQQQFQQSLASAEQEKKNCEAAQGTAAAGNYPSNCADMYQPTAEDYNPDWFMPATFEFVDEFPNMVTTLAAILAVVAFVIGASFVGAEWASGGMMNLLLWRPQRVRVLGTKLAALLVGLTALTVVLAAIWTGLFLLIGNLRGNTDGLTSGAWQSIGLMELRALGLVLVAGALGFGLASIGRHTAMALGAAIGVIVVFQFGLGTVLFMANVKFAEAYLAPTWVTAWMAKEYKVEDFNSCDFNSVSGCQPDSLTVTWPMAGGLLAAVFVLVTAASLWTIRSRDIT